MYLYVYIQKDSMIRERPFNLKRGGGGGGGIMIPNVAEKNILILVEEKK